MMFYCFVREILLLHFLNGLIQIYDSRKKFSVFLFRFFL